MAEEVALDLATAYEYYQGQREGLGEEFFSCVDAAMRSILRSPTLHARVFDDVRRCLLRRFPYVVHYEHVGNTVTVHAVLHTSRRPDSWRSRLT